MQIDVANAQLDNEANIEVGPKWTSIKRIQPWTVRLEVSVRGFNLLSETQLFLHRTKIRAKHPPHELRQQIGDDAKQWRRGAEEER